MTSPLEQKKIKIAGPSVVTANRTFDGVVIWRTAGKGWSTDLADATVVSTADDARTLLTDAVELHVAYAGGWLPSPPIEPRSAVAVISIALSNNALSTSPAIVAPPSSSRDGEIRYRT